MAGNVFGDAITTETLREMPKYDGRPITRFNRAQEALSTITDGAKYTAARKFAEGLRSQCGHGVTTLGVFYNATGDPVRYVADHDWHGRVWKSPYPVEVQNGQWGAFLHAHAPGTMAGSSACVAYCGKNQKGEECDYLLAWYNPWWRFLNSCSAYTELSEAGRYTNGSDWSRLQSFTEKSELAHTDEWNGCLSEVSIGNDTSCIFQAILTLTVS